MKHLFIKGHKHSDKTKQKLSTTKIGNLNPKWKGGKFKSHGYLYILKQNHPFAKTNGYILEHRLVMEKKIGRYLKPSEIIHHINGIKDDNNINNLVITNRNKHLTLHREITICSIDGCKRNHWAKKYCSYHYQKLIQRKK